MTGSARCLASTLSSSCKERLFRGHDPLKKNPNRVLLMFFLWACFLSGCSKPVPVEFNNACQKENDNKYISVEGYLITGATVLCSSREGRRECGLDLTDKLDGENKISVYVEEGSGKSQMETLPKSYSKDDLKVHATDGQILTRKDRVRIVGELKLGPDVANTTNSICYIDVERVEKP